MIDFSSICGNNKKIALSLLLLISATLSSCASSGGPLSFMDGRIGYACNVVKVYYDYDFDKINKLLYDKQDPDVFEVNTIYDLRGEMEFMAEHLIKNNKFRCTADYESRDVIVAHGTIVQQWDHGTGWIEFSWDFYFDSTGDASLQKFQIEETVKEYEPVKEEESRHS